jgi:hypothetical protein
MCAESIVNQDSRLLARSRLRQRVENVLIPVKTNRYIRIACIGVTEMPS